MAGTESSRRLTIARTSRVFAWPRSPRRIRSWPARMPRSRPGKTVSSNPRIPGKSSWPSSSRSRRLARSSCLTVRSGYPDARSSPSVVAWVMQTRVAGSADMTTSTACERRGEHRGSEKRHRQGEQAEGSLGRSSEPRVVEPFVGPVVVDGSTFDRDRVPPEPPDRCRQDALRRRQRRARRGGQQTGPREAAELGERTGESGERTPAQREPQVRMERPVEPLEVVRERDERPDDDEPQHPRRDDDRTVDAERDRASQPYECDRDEHDRWDRGPEGSTVQLIEGVRAQTDRPEEGKHRPGEVPEVDVGDRAGTDDDVREVPQRVRRVEQGHVVAPSAGREGIERRSFPLRCHRFNPQVTIAAPLDIVRVWTLPIPAASHQPSCSWSGWTRQCSSIDRLRKRAVLAHAGETIDPTSGITCRVYGSHAASAHRASGTWNSSDATTPPGVTALASSFIVAGGSST